MSGEAQALGKILDGIKELGKALLPEETHKPTTASNDPHVYNVVSVDRNLLYALMAAAKDDDIWRHAPMGLARPVNDLLEGVFPGWNS